MIPPSLSCTKTNTAKPRSFYLARRPKRILWIAKCNTGLMTIWKCQILRAHRLNETYERASCQSFRVHSTTFANHGTHTMAATKDCNDHSHRCLVTRNLQALTFMNNLDRLLFFLDDPLITRIGLRALHRVGSAIVVTVTGLRKSSVIILIHLLANRATISPKRSAG